MDKPTEKTTCFYWCDKEKIDKGLLCFNKHKAYTIFQTFVTAFVQVNMLQKVDRATIGYVEVSTRHDL